MSKGGLITTSGRAPGTSSRRLARPAGSGASIQVETWQPLGRAPQEQRSSSVCWPGCRRRPTCHSPSRSRRAWPARSFVEGRLASRPHLPVDRRRSPSRDRPRPWSRRAAQVAGAEETSAVRRSLMSEAFIARDRWHRILPLVVGAVASVARSEQVNSLLAPCARTGQAP